MADHCTILVLHVFETFCLKKKCLIGMQVLLANRKSMVGGMEI